MSRLFTVGLITSWYSSNIGVLLLNKFLLSNYGFRYPISLTLCHMLACSMFSYMAIAWLKVAPLQGIRSRLQLMKISALGVIFCLSVVGGNISLRFLPVSFNQAVGATTPFFTAVFAYVMTRKRESWVTYATLVPVVTGVIIASGVRLQSLILGFVCVWLFCLWWRKLKKFLVFINSGGCFFLFFLSRKKEWYHHWCCFLPITWLKGEPLFHLFGFIMCIGATAARALKSVLQGILLSSEG